jgi:hypothetical protein
MQRVCVVSAAIAGTWSEMSVPLASLLRRATVWRWKRRARISVRAMTRAGYFVLAGLDSSPGFVSLPTVRELDPVQSLRDASAADDRVPYSRAA